MENITQGWGPKRSTYTTQQQGHKTVFFSVRKVIGNSGFSLLYIAMSIPACDLLLEAAPVSWKLAFYSTFILKMVNKKLCMHVNIIILKEILWIAETSAILE